MSAANFERCLAFTLKYEGGKSNDPRDPGGRTMQGVTQRTYNAFRARRGLAAKDVFAMPAAERDEIYRTGYWNAVNGDRLREGEDLCVFDFAVNSGPARARNVWLKCGGANALPVQKVIHDLCARRLSFLRALRTWQYFGAGWGRRVAACEALATSMAYGKAAPEVLAKKAAEAKRRSAKTTTQAVVGGTAAGAMGLAHYLNTGEAMMVIIGAVLVALITGVFLFNGWRHRQRADALGEAVEAIKGQPERLEVKTKWAVSEAELSTLEAAKKAQELAAAKLAISELGETHAVNPEEKK